MTYDGLVVEICSRVNDPDKDTFGDRASELVYEGIAALAKSGEFGKDDIPGIMKTKGITIDGLANEYQIKIYGSTNELDNDSVLKIIAITDDPLYITDSKYKFIFITVEELNRISNDSDLNPLSDELFFWEYNNNLRFYPIDRLSGQYIYIHYIKDPGTYDDAAELTGIYSTHFQYQVIGYATDRLRAEIAGA